MVRNASAVQLMDPAGGKYSGVPLRRTQAKYAVALVGAKAQTTLEPL